MVFRFRKSTCSTSQTFVGFCEHVTAVGKGKELVQNPGGAGTHTGHTGHTDHTDKPHNQPDPPTHTPRRRDHGTTPRPRSRPNPRPTQKRPPPANLGPCPGCRYRVHTGKTRYIILSPAIDPLQQVQLLSSSTGLTTGCAPRDGLSLVQHLLRGLRGRARENPRWALGPVRCLRFGLCWSGRVSRLRGSRLPPPRPPPAVLHYVRDAMYRSASGRVKLKEYVYLKDLVLL